MRIPVRSDRRAGMTLIEILVVIAIIVILVSLIAGGVMVVLNKGPAMKNRQDLDALAVELERFYAKHQLYPPSRILLLPNGNAYLTSTHPLAKSSLNYLTKIWPNLDMATNIAWAGNVMTVPATGFVLDGDQCLVFFLGGIPDSSGGVIGFSGNPANPADPTVPHQKRIKFYEFDSGRLYQREAGNPFPSYKDQFSIARGTTNPQPYVYFSSNGRANGYDAPLSGQTSVIPTLNLSPYIQTAGPPTVYYEPSKYQLVSSGRDGQFGPGGLWAPATVNTMATAGKDDMTNFYDVLMGVAK